jgi:hypothetical protein
MSGSQLLKSRPCSSLCQNRAISLPEAFLGQVWYYESSSRKEASQRSASVCQRRVLWLPRLMFATDGVLSRRHDDRRCDFRRRFSSVLFCDFPRLMHAMYGILCRRCDDRRRDARHRFASVLSCGFPRLIALYLES